MKNKILIVDDDINLRKTVSDILSIKGYAPIIADRGETALEIVKKETPSVALIDLKLGDMSGIDVLREIKKLFPDTECILLTGYATQKSAIEAVNSGAYGYIQKPCDVEQLLIMIQRAIEKREAAVELKEREEWFRTVVNASKDAMISIDHKGLITIFNAAAQKMFGIKEEEMIGQTITRLIPEDYREKHNQCIKNYSDTVDPHNTSGKPTELSALRSDGTIFPIELSISSGHLRDKQFVLAIIRDITERRLAEKEHIRMENHLRQAQKMEAIGTLAGGIAHDFNNILGAIMGYTELTLYDVSEESIIHKNLGHVLKACHRAKGLVNQILTFSRQTEQERKPVQISLVIKEALYLLRASLPSTIEIRQNIKDNKSLVLADPTQMHQILMNLCTNAAHAMKEKGGILEVTLTDVEIEPETSNLYHDLKPGAYLRLTVSDTGYGMTRAVMARLFEPYFTTKKKGEGTGMGLAVVHGIVKSHGGEISVYSEEEKGTVFHVYLPRIDSTVTPEEKSFSPLPRGKERILFVDDEEILVDLGKQVLEHLGYEVVALTGSIEALNVFRSEPDKFSLVITDLTMPKITGFELSRELLSIRSDIPIILCTGFSEGLNAEKIKAAGIRNFIMKPLVMKELAKLIRRILDEEKNVGMIQNERLQESPEIL